MSKASINTNIQAQYAAQNLRRGIADSKTHAIRLSSGNKITTAADDAAGLSIGTGLRTDTSTLRAGFQNTGQARAILNIADGALANISEILQRMKSLIVQSKSAAMSQNEKGYIDDELDKLSTEIDRIATQTKFNGQALLGGTFAGDFQVSFGANDVIGVNLNSIQAADLHGMISEGVVGTYDLKFVASSDTANINAATVASTAYETLTVQGGLGVFTGGGVYKTGSAAITDTLNGMATTYNPGVDPFRENIAENVIINPDESYSSSAAFTNVTSKVATVSDTYFEIEIDLNGTPETLVYQWNPDIAAYAVDTAINDVKSARASVGSIQSRFQFASANLETSIQNTDAARAAYLDADISDESSAFANAQVRIQAGISVLAKANTLSQQLVQLLQ